MRAGVSTVQQTLTVEAANVLKQAVSEACKRGHAQATPLHVAATLLVSPTSPLRRACLQTHPHSSHLPQCRALELCFNIALERLQAAQGALPNGQPSYSNALVAALKRAQAHQRRGCPEQQQQPLLAVKVELEQLIISILDDPSVSRVMREAGFSSIDVKSHLEEMVSLMTSHHSSGHSITDAVHFPLINATAMDQMSFRLGGVAPTFLKGFPLPHPLTPLAANASATQDRNHMLTQICPSVPLPLPLTPLSNGSVTQDRDHMLPVQICPPRTHSAYINPLLLKPGGVVPTTNGDEEIKQVLEVLMRNKMRNPVLLDESTARLDAIIKDVIQHFERGHVPEQLQKVKVISANLSFITLMNASKEELHSRFMELDKSVQELISTGGVIVNVGNLQWLLQPRASSSQLAGFCPVQHATHKIEELFDRHRDCNRMWLIGLATNQAYRNCQALYPALESQWDLQTISLGASGTVPSRRLSQERGTDSLTLSLLPSSAPTLQVSISGQDNGESLTCCLECTIKFEKEALILDQQCRNQPDSPQSCSSSVETPSTTGNEQGQPTISGSHPALPPWLQKALPDISTLNGTDTAVEVKPKAVPRAPRLQELRKKWNEACRSLHPGRASGWNGALEACQQRSSVSTQLSGSLSDRTLTLLRENSSGAGAGMSRPIVGNNVPASHAHQALRATSALSFISPNSTNVLSEQLLQPRAYEDRVQDDNNGCTASLVRFPGPAASAPALPQLMRNTEAAIPWSTPDSIRHGQPSRLFRRMNPEALGEICKGLAKKVGWQPRIISTIANTVLQCRSGLAKRAAGGVSVRGDTWLLFLGHDRPGKRLMAEALAELSFGEDKKPICLSFGKQQDVSSPASWSLGLSVTPRGKMPVDQLAEAVRHYPSSLLYLEDVEQADSMLKSALVRAMSRGRLVDSSGRDVNLSSVVVVMTTSAGLDGIEASEACAQFGNEDCSPHEEWNVGKRKGTWDVDDGTKETSCLSKRPNVGWLNLDLNLAAEEKAVEGDGGGGTALPEQLPTEEEVVLAAKKKLGELCDLVDAAVVFASPLLLL